MSAPRIPNHKPLFPIFATREEAEAYADTTGDAYYEICYWLEGRLNLCLATLNDVYTNSPPTKRSGHLQNGSVRQRICLEGFKNETLQAIMKTCQCYASEDTAHAYTMREALAALNLELEHRGISFEAAIRDVEQTRLVLGWLCDWLESGLHFLVHQSWYNCMDAFSPDAEISHLSNLGFVERHLKNLPARDKERFHGLLDRAATKHGETKLWSQVGKVMHDPQPRTWTHPEVDAMVIGLWPLDVRYNWTYADLLKVMDKLLPLPRANEERKYPLDSVESLKVHSRSVCGLAKRTKGKTAKGMPDGWPIAQKLFTAMGN